MSKKQDVVIEEANDQEITEAEFFGSVVEEQEKSVAIRGDRGGVAIFNPDEIRFFSSLDRNTNEGKQRTLKALGTSDYTLKNVAEKKVMMVEHIVAHTVQLTNDDGTISDADRIIMVMEDGQTVSGCSKGFKSSMSNLIAVYGKPPFAPALPIVVMDVTTRNGNNTFNLSIADGKCELPVIGAKK